MFHESDCPASDLLARNKEWARLIRERDPCYFPNLASRVQEPRILWIGCSDSRVAETTICDCGLGIIFTHRNIANLVQLADDSVQSVIAYAVTELLVDHIIVVGHSKCGGVKAAWSASKGDIILTTTPLERWLVPLIELSKKLGLDKEPDEEIALYKLTEANIKQQVFNVANTEPVKEALKNNRDICVRGWKFQIENGELVVIPIE